MGTYKPTTWAALGILLLAITGCTNATPSAVVTFATVTEGEPTPYYTSTLIPTPTTTVRPTESLTATQPRPTATWTPRATLPPPEAEKLVLELMTTNGGCELPCWWGLTPHQSNWEVARAFLATFGQVSTKLHRVQSDLYLYYGTFPAWDKALYPFGVQATLFVDKDRVVELIVTNYGLPLQLALTRLGTPTQIWIKITEAPPGYSPSYELFLFYPPRGILAGYHGFGGVSSSGKDESLSICASDLHKASTGLYRWSPQQQWTFRDVTAPMENVSERDYRLLEEASQIDAQDFYGEFATPDSQSCFDVPIR